MLPAKLAFVDLETSGSSGNSDRIIEIGILRVENNKVVKKFKSLINPQTHVSDFISDMTGIFPHDLENAPTFRQIKDEVAELLQDAVFVAHNVRFDYGFIRNEFKRQGVSFTAKNFCTVKLFRALHPELYHHNLDSLIEYYNLKCTNRHRAFDDAKVLWDFYKHIQKKYPLEIVEKHVELLLKKPTLPVGLTNDQLDNLPENPGVYIFYGDDGTVLYVGKSVNIRDRVLSHFSSDTNSHKEMKIVQSIKSLETISTNTELEALILESQLVKSKLPIFNRQLRQKSELTVIRQQLNSDGYSTVSTESVSTIDPETTANILGICRSQKDAKKILETAISEHKLCAKLMGLEKSKGACFGRQINKCNGACEKKENPGIYNVRFLEAFAGRKVKAWPFKGPIVIYKKLLVDNWCLMDGTFDWDTYKILSRFVFDAKNQNTSSLSRAPDLQKNFLLYPLSLSFDS